MHGCNFYVQSGVNPNQYVITILPTSGFQGGGQVQEQRSGDKQPEETPVPHPIGQVQGENRVRHQRRSASFQDSLAESRYRHFKVQIYFLLIFFF